MRRELTKIRAGLKKEISYATATPLWDAFYVKEQNRKFKNKWDKIKRLNAKR